jgi:hypothetical protein
MNEETPNETEVSSNPSGPVITTENKTTEVLDANGKSISGGDSALSKIFDKVASGEDVADAVKATMKTTAKAVKPLFDEKIEEPAATKEVEPEIVIENKAEAKEAAPKLEDKTEVEEEVPEADLQVLPHDKPKTAQRINALWKKANEATRLAETTKKEIEEKDKRLKEIEDQLKSVSSVDPLTNEKVKAHIKELGMYRRRYELETSPEVKEKFDARITNAEETIASTLAARGAPASILDVVKQEGGWLKFVDSQRPITLANGKEITGAELADQIKMALPASERRRIEALELEQIQVSRDKQTYFNEESKKAKDYFSQQEQQRLAAQEEHKKRFDEAVKVANDWKKRFSEENEWIREKEIGANLTKEQKDALEDHNKHAKQLNSMLEKRLAAKDINEMLEVLVDSIKYHQERKNLASQITENQRLQAQLKAKQDELDKFKRAGSTVGKSGSLSASGGKPTDSKTTKPPSLEDAFERLAEGKSLEE